MKKLLVGLVALAIVAGGLFSSRVRAGITCTLPFTLQNNTIADATQVMANYNALVACFTSAAAAGANSDITSLLALSTPVPIAGGGSSVYIGGTSTGSANAQVVSSTVPTGFSLTAGKRVTFIAGTSNTAATTLNVNAQGALSIFRRTQLGASAMVGGEIVIGQLVEVVYDGTQFQLLGPVYLVGEGRDWFTTTAPTGWLLRDGSSLLRADYADLFTVIGTTYGTVDGTHFTLPDERGRMSVMKDSAARITGTCAAANTLGTVCGTAAGSLAITQTYLPNITLTTNITDPGHFHVDTSYNPTGTAPLIGGNTGAGGTNTNTASAVTGITAGTPLGGSGTVFPILNGSQVVNKIIKY